MDSLWDFPDFDEHELVHFITDRESGLKAVIAVHSTHLGPGAGGTRFWHYADPSLAIADVLRLSRGMSYKNAMAGLPLGGGKAVVMVDGKHPKSPQLLAAFGRLVDSLEGRYITAEDVGATVSDMEVVATQTPYVSGLPRTAVAADGNPAPKTALGVYLGIKAAVQFQLGRSSLRGITVGVQGLGGVGYALCGLLAADGASLRVADIRVETVQRACKEFDALASQPNEILFERVDVLSPCALGAVFDGNTIPRVQATIIAGAANNQLATVEDGARLHAAGVLYAPDYVINAGGIISVGREYLGGASAASIEAEIRKIPERLTEIFARSRAENRPTSDIADEMAKRLIRPA
jgi:leucine dehydrogenase